MTGEQATLGETSGEEGGGEADAGREPGGSDPVTTYPYPDIGDKVAPLDDEDVGTPTSFEDLNTGPNLQRSEYGPCPVCGEWSDKSYRCSECGKPFDGATTKGRDTDTAVGD